MLSEYHTKLNSVILRHETRYDVLQDFTPSHLAMLENFSYRTATQSAAKVEGDEGYLGHARTFVKDRCVYKRDSLDCSIHLICSAQLLGAETEKEKSKIDVLRPELLAANISLHKSISLKRKLGEYVHDYDSFVQSVDKHLDGLATGSDHTIDGRADGDEALYLPLHDYGAYSQTSETGPAAEALAGDADGKASLTSMQIKENNKVECLLESLLLKRLRGAMQTSVSEQQHIAESLESLAQRMAGTAQ